LIGFSPEFQDAQRALKRFLNEHLYSHPHVREMTEQAGRTVRKLFATFCDDYDRMPPKHAARARARSAAHGAAAGARVVADYIAGMTDRFALQTVDGLGD